MKKINIDDIPCRKLTERIAYNEFTPWSQRNFIHNSYRSIGFKPERLLDWRQVERKFNELNQSKLNASAQYWEMLKSFSKACKNAGGNGVVWMPDHLHEYVDVYDGRTLTSLSFKRVFDSACEDPSNKPMVVSGDDLTYIRRLKERQNTLRKRARCGWLAFHMAIEIRLDEFIRTNLLSVDTFHDIFYPCIFIIENDDRQYVVTSDHYVKFTWNEGDVYHC